MSERRAAIRKRGFTDGDHSPREEREALRGPPAPPWMGQLSIPTTKELTKFRDDRVLRIDMATLEVTVFAESINGADGIAFDKQGILWVAANQADEVVGLDAKGRIVARLGEFRGIRRDGTADGLLFPASPVIYGDDIFVTNLALPLNGVAGDEPEEDVTRWTISRLRLPRGQGH